MVVTKADEFREKNLKFLSRIDSDLIRLDYSGLSLVLYRTIDTGSLDDMCYHGFFILPEAVVINQDKFERVSGFASGIKQFGLDMFGRDIIKDLDAIDYGTVKDSRFNYFNPEFGKPHFGSPLVIGTKYSSCVKCEKPENRIEEIFRYNFRKLRKEVLLSSYSKDHDEHHFILDSFRFALGAAFESYNNLSYMSKFKYNPTSENGFVLKKLFDKLEFLDESGISLNDRIDVSGFYCDNYGDFKNIWCLAVNVVEDFVKLYINQFPIGKIEDPIVELGLMHAISGRNSVQPEVVMTPQHERIEEYVDDIFKDL